MTFTSGFFKKIFMKRNLEFKNKNSTIDHIHTTSEIISIKNNLHACILQYFHSLSILISFVYATNKIPISFNMCPFLYQTKKTVKNKDRPLQRRVCQSKWPSMFNRCRSLTVVNNKLNTSRFYLFLCIVKLFNRWIFCLVDMRTRMLDYAKT